MDANGQSQDEQAKGILAPASPKVWVITIGVACLIAGVVITNVRNGGDDHESVAESSDTAVASATSRVTSSRASSALSPLIPLHSRTSTVRSVNHVSV